MSASKNEKLGEIEQMAKNGTWLYDLKDQLRDYVYALSDKAFERGDSARDAVADKAGIEKRQEYIKECFVKAVGGLPEPSADLDAKITGTLRFDGYRVEKIIYKSRENVYVTANMYIPDGLNGKTGAVLFVCGHHQQGKHVAEYQIVCQYFVRAGLIVFAQDPIGQGERFSYMDENGQPTMNCVEEHDYAGFQCSALGKGLARYFVHDSMRAIDYLVSRPEVDAEKIGITGNSGGGTQSSMMMLAERRLAAAAPATFIMNRKYYMKTGQAQDREQIWNGLTACGIDHEDTILSMAPKPVLILGVAHDFFPIESTEKTYRRCRRFWDIYGKSDCIERFYDDCDHHYTRKMAKISAAFFAKHLLGREIDPEAYIDDSLVEAIDEKVLHCAKTGQVLTSFGDARAVYDENNVELQLRQPGNKEKALKFLRERVNKNRTEPVGYFMKRWLGEAFAGDLQAEGYLWMAQEDIINSAVIFKSKENADKKLPVTIALWDGGSSNLAAHADFIEETCKKDRAVLALDLTGMGIAAQRAFSAADPLAFYGAMFKLNDDLAWLDDSLAAIRVHDIIRLVDIIENNWNEGMFDSGGIEMYTRGRYSAYADIAKFLDGRIKKVASDEPLTSYRDFIANKFYDRRDIASVILPGLLEYADLDEIRQWSQ